MFTCICVADSQLGVDLCSDEFFMRAMEASPSVFGSWTGGLFGFTNSAVVSAVCWPNTTLSAETWLQDSSHHGPKRSQIRQQSPIVRNHLRRRIYNQRASAPCLVHYGLACRQAAESCSWPVPSASCGWISAHLGCLLLSSLSHECEDELRNGGWSHLPCT